METVWDKLQSILSENAVNFALKLLLGFIVLIVGFRLVRLLTKLFHKGKAVQKLDPTVKSFIESFGSVLLKALVIVIFAGIVGIPTASIVAVLGSVGVAIGLAMQGSLSNLAGGVMILLFKPFETGDYIDLPNAVAGTVSDISIFYTTLETLDNRRVVVPNSVVSNSTLTNYSANETRRIELNISAEYGADSEAVRETMLAAAAERPALLPEPAPAVLMTAMEGSAIVYQLRCWCKTGDYLAESAALRELIKRRFEEKGIVIPFPQVDVHMK